MNELKDLIDNLDLENNNYFYHITGKGFGEEIIENGLYMEDSSLYSTTIRLPEEMIKDPITYCIGEYSDGLVKRQEMVIIGCEKGEEQYLVQDIEDTWIEGNKYNYAIPSEYILGYIDLKDLVVNYNENYMYGGRHV